MYKQILLFLIGIFLYSLSFSQERIERIEPPFWWKDMAEPQLQLLVYGNELSELNVLINNPLVKLNNVHAIDNPNYLFIDLEIVTDGLSDKQRSHYFDITFEYQREVVQTIRYELKPRKEGSAEREGFDNSDVIYLLMPDRFANGDPSNDNHPEMLEKVSRSNPNGRHGGDIAGIRERLDYLKDLGVSALWINPLLENNMEAYSYHGYAITDFYRIDPRFGSNEDYVELVEECHDRGIKVIMDQVFNHCGSNHWWIKDLPAEDWIHQFPEYTPSNYRGETIMDPYASEADKKRMLRGWFDRTMPDMNQNNLFLANYLIQNSIWWVEYAGLGGIRMDTYPYSYADFMKRWVKRMDAEYSKFRILGEAWLQKEAHTAYFLRDTMERFGYNTHLNTVTDFPMHYALVEAFNEKDSWTEGLARLYYTLTQDYLYSDAMNTVVFADNHDLSRYFTLMHEDLDKWKMGMAFLYTTRGIPMVYYGTEILMTGEESEGHGYIREDFPGGWPGDTLNAFVSEGRTPDQEEAFQYLKMLINWRKAKEVIHSGGLMHFIPDDGLYVYFRYDDEDAVMVVMNNNETGPKEAELSDYDEITGQYSVMKDIMTGEEKPLEGVLTIGAKSVLIFDLE